MRLYLRYQLRQQPAILAALLGLLAFATLCGLLVPLPEPGLPPIPVGSRPTAVAVHPVTGLVYVANWGDGTVSVLDQDGRGVLGTVNVGSHPASLALNPVTDRLYVATDDATLVVMDTRAYVVLDRLHVGAALPGGTLPLQIAVNAATGRVYVPDFDKGTLDVVDGGTDTLLPPVTVGSHPAAVAVNPATGRIYTANAGDGTMSVLDGGSHATLATIAVGIAPRAIAIDSTVDRIYAANYFGGTVAVLDGASNRMASSVAVGPYPQGVGVNPATHRAYVSRADGGVAVLEGTTLRAILATGREPAGVAVSAVTNRVYVTDRQDDTLNVLQDRRWGMPSLGARQVMVIAGPWVGPCVAAVAASANGADGDGCSR